MTVIILALGLAAPIVAAFNFVNTLAQAGTTVALVDEILKSEEQARGTQCVAFSGRSIEVSFGYPDDAEIPHDVSLRIPQNSMTALVGPSGSGKSTLAKLIAGFWDVKHGTITMGGHDLKEIPLEQLCDQVAFVSQDNYLFDDTVRENIRMGRRDATDAEVEAAAASVEPSGIAPNGTSLPHFAAAFFRRLHTEISFLTSPLRSFVYISMYSSSRMVSKPTNIVSTPSLSISG